MNTSTSTNSTASAVPTPVFTPEQLANLICAIIALFLLGNITCWVLWCCVPQESRILNDLRKVSRKQTIELETLISIEKDKFNKDVGTELQEA
ncbi:hypothetical protein LOD99_15972 [Oopsacas minuta]|uniref:Uncharacterized protein n=1 Tax=Oopsacas minuta TaxID=111878 RepID=A0AAV7K7D3_9METZ|nr:hypothetical protein LOD99_15972 [Oopsacas minuta]